MKIMIEGMTTAFLLAVACGLLAGLIGVSVQANQARNYHSSVIDQLENSLFRSEVQEYLIAEAAERQYRLEIKEVTEKPGDPAYYVTLEYPVTMPVFRVLGGVFQKQGCIEGYAG